MEILIIDDDEVDRTSIMRALKNASQPASFTHAATASQAFELVESKLFDLILLDFRLPDQDGIEVLKTLRAKESRQSAIIMVSNQDDDLLALQAIDAGAQDFLLKEEVNPRRLQRALNQAKHRYSLELSLIESREELSFMAEHDSLTGLANRRDFDRSLNLAVSGASRGRSFAVLMLDIDHFKRVNDIFGHDVGDQLLIEVSKRLKIIIRESDLLARLGGDEFVILCQDLSQDVQPSHLARRIQTDFAEPILIEGSALTITVSIGIAVYGEHAHSAIDLMKCADIAMYRAKKEGRNKSQFFSHELQEALLLQLQIEKDMRKALIQNQFVVYFQPQINADDGTLGGLEALLRWEHPTLGVLLPSYFLEVAEEVGLMEKIGELMLLQACKQFQDWRVRFNLENQHLKVAFNLSASEIQKKDLIAFVDHALTNSGLAPDCLELEITENALILNPEKIVKTMVQLNERGVKLSLDDFGTGYSSFEHLKLFPIHSLKIDRSFVNSIDEGEADQRLLSAMIQFAKTLGLTVVAEGVETARHVAFCREHGCDLLQGFYYDKALSATDFELKYLEAKISVRA